MKFFFLLLSLPSWAAADCGSKKIPYPTQVEGFCELLISQPQNNSLCLSNSFTLDSTKSQTQIISIGAHPEELQFLMSLVYQGHKLSDSHIRYGDQYVFVLTPLNETKGLTAPVRVDFFVATDGSVEASTVINDMHFSSQESELEFTLPIHLFANQSIKKNRFRTMINPVSKIFRRKQKIKSEIQKTFELRMNLQFLKHHRHDLAVQFDIEP